MKHNKLKIFLVVAGLLTAVFVLWQTLLTPQKNADWQGPLAVQAHAEFNGDTVLIKNIRNFRYESEEEFSSAYYDQIYDLSKLNKVWYIVEPFGNTPLAAHTFLSFEFSDDKYITISIEARKKKGQDYNMFLGLFRTYPLMYIAADERDAILMRTTVRKNKVYLYPVKIEPAQAKVLFVDILKKMNDLDENPDWYNTLTANCTSAIAGHVNKIWPKLLPAFSWQVWITGYADILAFDRGLIETNLSLEEARKKYYVTDISQKIGDVPDYSKLIRQFGENN